MASYNKVYKAEFMSYRICRKSLQKFVIFSQQQLLIAVFVEPGLSCLFTLCIS